MKQMHASGRVPKRRASAKPSKRRTTLTLPTDTLMEAERIARARKVNLSTVIAEVLAEGLRLRSAVERSDRVLKAYEQAFGGFSEDEMMILDGIVLEPIAKR